MSLCRSTRLTAATLAVLTSFAAAAADRETLTLDTQGIKSFRISAESGYLHIEGVDAGKKIEVIAEHEGDKDNHRLTLKRDGDRAELISHIEDWPLGWGDERINLTVKVPAGLSLDIEDGSGELTLSKVNGKTRIDDGSGSISISTHQGNIRINDGSGSIDVINVVGDVDIEDGSGSIEVSKVDGHVTIDDGSGSIDIDTVSKGLTIEDEGSGGLRTRNIKGGIDQRR
jgi:hypothetical protein